MRRSAPALVVLCAALALGLSACGGSDTTVVVTKTVDGTTAGGTPTATNAPAATLADRLPPAGAVPGFAGGTVRTLPTAQAVVDALYSEGDSAKPAAVLRYEAAGYRDGVVRDQTVKGSDPGLFRAYVVKLGSPAAAAAEVNASTDEVRRSSSAGAADVAVPGIPGARGLTLRTGASGQQVVVLLATFAAGPYLYGYQAITLADRHADQDQVLAAARAAYRRWGSVP